jgi:hypothetical protein
VQVTIRSRLTQVIGVLVREWLQPDHVIAECHGGGECRHKRRQRQL